MRIRSGALWGGGAAVLAIIGVAGAVTGNSASHRIDQPVAERAAQAGICGLLTEQEVEAVTHASISFTQPGGDDDRPSCTYVPGEGALYPVTVEIQRTGGRQATSSVKTVGAGLGLGEESSFGPADSAIYLLKGDTCISLQFGLSRGTREEKVELARRLLSRL